MRWFLNLSTSAKLYASFGLMIVLLAVVAAEAYRSVTLIQASQRALYEQEFTDVLDIKDIRANQIANRADLLSMMVPGSRAEVAALEAAIGERSKRTDEGIARLRKRNQADPESLDKLQKFEALRRSSLQTRESQTLPLIRAGKLEEARLLHLGVQAERDAQLDAIADDFVARTEQTARVALARSDQAARNALRLFLATGFIAVLVAALLTMLLNRTLSDPLKEISAAAERVAGGDLTVQLPAGSRADETGILMRTFGRMIASLREMTRDLSAEKQFLRNLMDNIPDSIFFKDREHRFLRINRAHAAVLGLASPQDVVGKATSDFFPLDDARRRDAEDREVMLSGVPLPDKVRRISRPGGKLRWTSTTKAPVKDENGEVIGLVGIARDVSERVRLQEELREREAGLHRAQLLARLAHVITRPDGSFESWSETLPQLIGVDAARMPQSTREWLEILHPDDRLKFREKSIEAAATGKRLDVEYRLRRAGGEWIDVRQVIEPMQGEPDAQGRLRWFSTLQDVTEQKQAETKITRLNRVYAVLSGINALIVRVRDREELYREACRIAAEAGQLRMAWLGVYDSESMMVKPVAWHGREDGFLKLMALAMAEPVTEGRGLVRRAVREKAPVILNDIEHDAAFHLRQEALDRGYRSATVLPLIVAGEVIGVLGLFAAEAQFFDDDEMRLLTELASDIAFALEHIQKAEKLDYLSYYDPLTGLANRSLFHERLAQHVSMANREKHSFALCIMDVERFKTINDTLGRHAGDALLRQIAERLSANLDASLVARIGADHFALLVPDATSEERVVRSLEKGRERLEGQPYPVGGTELRLSTKAGIAVFPDDGADAESLFRNAEAALKKAKAIGERYLFYAQEMTERVHEKLALENKLRQALEKDEFVLHYQAKVDLQTRRIVGVEALIRWQTAQGLVPPMKFIPLLEETGLILQAGSWALKRAALDHRRWVEQGFKALRVAVNVSPIQLRQRDFVGVVEQAIIEGIAPTGIDLEITESVVMQDIEANIEKLNSVCELGVNIAIDDFGTGYSSLAYLAKLPVETLKIDRSFVIAMPKDPDSATLVQTMISLAHSLKLIVVAEGVDSEEQATILRLFRCDQMQGYLFSKPLPVGEMTALLKAKV